VINEWNLICTGCARKNTMAVEAPTHQIIPDEPYQHGQLLFQLTCDKARSAGSLQFGAAL